MYIVIHLGMTKIKERKRIIISMSRGEVKSKSDKAENDGQRNKT